MIDILKGIKLTIVQWLSIMAVVVIGGLVAALKLQGSRLHKAKVDLLKERLDRKIDERGKKVKVARKKFLEAMDEYRRSK